jgi:OOP family OmpA-OmpF porin
MITQFKTQLQRSFLLGMFLVISCVSNAQMSYEEFHAKYIPTYEKILPDFETVKLVNDMDAETGALVIMLLMQQAEAGDEESQLKIVAILTSCKREVVIAILNALDTETAVKALNYVNFDWQREIMWFADKITYHNIAPNLVSILLWEGPQGPFGPQIGDWSLAYAGLGFDKGVSGFKGANEFLDTYGNGVLLNGLTGFNAFAGIRTSGAKFINFSYQNRSSKAMADEYGASTARDIKYGAHTLSISLLKCKTETPRLFKFAHGAGLQVNFAKWSTDNGSGWQKAGGGINGGLNYNVKLFINPVKKLPVMLSLGAYAQLNLPGLDFNGLYDTLYSIPITTPTANDEYKSGIAMFGVNVNVIYKFGKATDDRVFTDFDTEVVSTMDNHVNTSYTEILPVISPDGKTLYFIRSDHPTNTKGSYASQDVWVADISNGIENATAKRLSTTPFNSQTYNMIAGVSPDGNTMLIKGVFGSDGELVKQGYSFINRTKEGWTKPVALNIPGYEDMTKGDYIGANWSQDGKHILLSMSTVDGKNEQDLYVTHLQEDGSWSKPVSLGTTINSADTDEHSPFLASDGKTLYYSSDREGGLGSNDIWMVKREDDTWTKWSEPVNMGADVNTDSWDAYYTIDAQGKYAYKASDKNSKGKEDIVRIQLKEEVQPDPVVLISGKVLNKKTNEPLDATIEYNGLVDGKNYGVARTNPATGEYTIVLPYGVNYDFSAFASGYMGVSENLDLTGVGEYQEIKRDLYLVPIEVGATVRLNNIFFETGKAELKAESFTELNRVIEFLQQNPNVKIELSGHTDNVGNADFNKSLSQKRADSVMAYLISKGIDASRLVAVGYGMEKPVADNTTEEGKAMNRRVEFTILSN